MLQNKKIIAQFGLLITALIWGATFIVVKDALFTVFIELSASWKLGAFLERI